MKIKEKKLWGKRESISVSQALKSTCLALAVFVLAFVFVPYLVMEANATSSHVAADVTWTPISLTLNNAGDVSFGNITPSSAIENTSYGTFKVVRK